MSEKSVSSVLALAAEVEERCNEIARDRDNMRVVMEAKLSNGEPWETEREAFNDLLKLHIETDRVRMKYVMEAYHMQKRR